MGDPFGYKWINVPIIKGDDAEFRSPQHRDTGMVRDTQQSTGLQDAPRLRADARRNEEALLEAAKRVFARSGVDAPIREIASEAGVGLGTLYRRFPTRADLVASVFQREVDACAEEARTLSGQYPPLEALTAWLMRYTGFLVTKQGLAAALHSGSTAFSSLPDYFRSRFEPALSGLMAKAVAAGAIRADIPSYDLLRAIGNLAVATGDDGSAPIERMVNLLVDGLRDGTTTPKQFDLHRRTPPV